MRTMTPGFRAVLSSGYAKTTAPPPAPDRELADAMEAHSNARLMFQVARGDHDRNFWARRMGHTWARLERVRINRGEV